MSKVLGTSQHQAPLNSDLGELAYLNKIDVLTVADNLIINGGFTVYQRDLGDIDSIQQTLPNPNGTNAHTQRTLDHWEVGHGDGMTVALERGNTVGKLSKEFRLIHTSATKTTNELHVRQVIENGTLIFNMFEKWTVSCWVKTNISGLVAQVGSHKSAPIDNSGEWNYVKFTFRYDGGATSNMAPYDHEEFRVAPENIVNIPTGGYIHLKEVKIEPGEQATPFLPRPFDEELRLCHRYYERETVRIPAYRTGPDTGTKAWIPFNTRKYDNNGANTPSISITASQSTTGVDVYPTGAEVTFGQDNVVISEYASEASLPLLEYTSDLLKTSVSGSIKIGLVGTATVDATVNADPPPGDQDPTEPYNPDSSIPPWKLVNQEDDPFIP